MKLDSKIEKKSKYGNIAGCLMFLIMGAAFFIAFQVDDDSLSEMIIRWTLIVGGLGFIVMLILFSTVRSCYGLTTSFAELERLYSMLEDNKDTILLQKYCEQAELFRDQYRKFERETPLMPPKLVNMHRRLMEMTSLLGISSDGPSIAREVEKLAELRDKGMISDEEFRQLSERFKLTTGEKAKEIVEAIEDLHRVYKSGALAHGNYQSAVWGLLDKLDRKI